MQVRDLPVGVQNFEKLRAGDFIYVDKTRYFHEMARPAQGFYFLSRPRRFGKSLTMSTLKCLFEGKRELFEGLWIERETEWEWRPHPVLVIDFNEIASESPEAMRETLSLSIRQTARRHEIVIESEYLQTQLQELIIGLAERHRAGVVVLIDEYDKPIIAHLGKGPEALDVARRNREIMKPFFGTLKGARVSECLRFVFLTGVSKFSRVSIFSELNNLEDITMAESYADMLGYNREEMVRYFGPHMAAMAEKLGIPENQMPERLAEHYDGYRFSTRDERVYNPFSVMSAMKRRAFDSYWFETGTPAFLVNLIRENRWHPPRIEDMKATKAMFSTYDLDDLRLEALLFQTGYVTIKEVGERRFTFDYPNREVKTAFLEALFHSYSKGIKDPSRFAMLADYLMDEDLGAFIETVRAIFASIPYALETRRDEAYFHALFYLMVSASGAEARSEVLTCEGRIDLVVAFSDKIYIIEFKCGQGAAAALRQIRDKKYAQKYRGLGKKIILMGIDFDPEKRNVAEWRWEPDEAARTE